jgi:hypothetical protein
MKLKDTLLSEGKYFDEFAKHVVQDSMGAMSGVGKDKIHLGGHKPILQNLHKVPTGYKIDCEAVHTLWFNETCTSFDLTGIGDWIIQIANHERMRFSDSNYGRIIFRGKPGPTKVLNFFFVKGLREAWFHHEKDQMGMQADTIVTRHLHKGQAGMIDCQHALIEAGFEDLV